MQLQVLLVKNTWTRIKLKCILAGKLKIFHQPRFPSHFLSYLWGPRSCEVPIIWPDFSWHFFQFWRWEDLNMKSCHVWHSDWWYIYKGWFVQHFFEIKLDTSFKHTISKKLFPTTHPPPHTKKNAQNNMFILPFSTGHLYMVQHLRWASTVAKVSTNPHLRPVQWWCIHHGFSAFNGTFLFLFGGNGD